MIGGDYILGKRADWGIHSLNADLTRFFHTIVSYSKEPKTERKGREQRASL
jgi:hypothetical protein